MPPLEKNLANLVEINSPYTYHPMRLFQAFIKAGFSGYHLLSPVNGFYPVYASSNSTDEPMEPDFARVSFLAKAGISTGKGGLLITGQKKGTQNSEVQYLAIFVLFHITMVNYPMQHPDLKQRLVYNPSIEMLSLSSQVRAHDIS
jgi:hypothetical protein